MARPIKYDPDEALRRAMELFWQHGFHAVSVELLVRDTGLNRHSLYSRYGNKYGLLERALDRYCDEAVDSIESVLGGDGTPRHRIERLLRLRHPDTEHDFWARVLRRGCLATRTVAELRDSHPDIGESLERIGTTVHAGLTETLRAAADDGSLDAARDPSKIASVLTCGFMSFSPTPSPDERIDAFLSLLEV